MKALVVLSGGLDSTVALYWAKKKYGDIEALTFHYGSRHNEREYFCALKTCENLQVKLSRINIDFVDTYFKSDLLKSGGEVPGGYYTADNIKSTVVPFRNGIMLSIATGFAESNDCDIVILGNHSGDHAIYPDCRADFIKSMAQAISFGTQEQIRLESPFCDITKTDIVKIGAELGVDFSSTWSCYKGGDKHCGKCGTCIERKEAFQKAGVYDPTIYED